MPEDVSSARRSRKDASREQKVSRKEKGASEAKSSDFSGVKVHSPFDELSEVWRLEDPTKQRQMVGELFEIEDRPGVCVESITLDLYYYNLLFSYESGFNLEQMKVFWKIMDNIVQSLKNESATPDSVFEQLKKAVLLNSPLAAHFASKEDAPSSNKNDLALATSTDNLPPVEVKVVEPSTKTKSTKDTKKGGKKGIADALKTEEEEAELLRAQQRQEAELKALAMFTVENVKQITDYASQTLFQHFALYKAVFCPAIFQPRRQVEETSFRLDIAIPDGLRLADAVETTDDFEEKRKVDAESRGSDVSRGLILEQEDDAVEADDEDMDDPEPDRPDTRDATTSNINSAAVQDETIAALVDEKVARVRADMMKMLKDQSKALETRIASQAQSSAPSEKSKKSKKKKKESKTEE